ncbi:MAG: hypothetical protein M1510_13420 [Nitrospirae bacterium]|nr:hypothetical protein [Nitrospirota bacterium]MCL5237845.1 hypothetical protein [Nitrospirota bacterium]
MRMKSIIALLIAMVFTLGVVGLGFAAGMKEVKGSVTKVEGKKVTVKDASGKEHAVEVKNAKDLKVGDNVVVKHGTATKEAAAAAAPAKKKAAAGGY